MGGECRIERYMPRQALPDFLRELADAVEHGGGEGEFESVNGFYKLKLSAKEEFGQLSVKMKLKSPKACKSEQADAPGWTGTSGEELPSYKKLKKRMRASFRMILKMLQAGQTPPAEAVASFLADAEVMTKYQGKGEEFYPDFTRACQDFSEAYASGDALRIGAIAEELAHQKARCHAIFK
jgi:XXXCH domain-containing protein